MSKKKKNNGKNEKLLPMLTRSLEGNWLRLKPHVDALERGDQMTTSKCKRACGKPLQNMLHRIKSYLMRERGIQCCIRDGQLRLMTNIEQAAVLPKAITTARRKLKRSVRAHTTVDIAELSPDDQRKHEYHSAKAAYLLGAHAEVSPGRLLTSPEFGIKKPE